MRKESKELPADNVSCGSKDYYGYFETFLNLPEKANVLVLQTEVILSIMARGLKISAQ
jgi:hypothetical protein